MAYSSLGFLVFVAITAIFYFLLPLKKNKWIVLLVSSYIFYMFAGYKYLAFILFTTISTYTVAILLERIATISKKQLKTNKEVWNKEQQKTYKNKVKTRKKLVLIIALFANFGILAFLKYYNFFADSLNDVFSSFSISLSAPTFNLLLPLGISFYTFQSLGYVIDIYRENYKAERNIAKFALFVSFFPQIVQGPISMYSQLASQLYEPHKVDFIRIKHACELILWGFFKKLVIADRAVIPINAVIDNYDMYNGTTLTFTILLYSIQLYADFSGGIDISRGVAQIFGIDMIDNFKRPYFSKSINEYWRRWHISLGNWMREYIFYPLAMSKFFINTSKKMKNSKFGCTKAGAHISKVLPTSIASLVVFLIVGIWHGASWKYVAFGLWNGGVIMISIILKPTFDNALQKLKINPKSFLWAIFQMIRTFLIVLVGYVFDIAPSFKQAMATFKSVLFNQNIFEAKKDIISFGLIKWDYFILAFGIIALFVVSVIQERTGKHIRTILDTKRFVYRWFLIVFILLFVLLFGIYGPGYDAADFVYMNF